MPGEGPDGYASFDGPSQSDKLKEAARQLKTDDEQERFEGGYRNTPWTGTRLDWSGWPA